MISRKVYEIAEILTPDDGYKVEMTSEQVLRWYDHLSSESNKQGYFRMTSEQKTQIVDLNGLGYDPSWISKQTGHTRATVSRILKDAEDSTLSDRVRRVQSLGD